MNYLVVLAANQDYSPGFIAGLLGRLFEIVFNFVENLGIGSENISAYAWTIIVMGLIYKLITVPATLQNAKNSARQRKLQPQMEELQKKYGYDQQIYQQKLMEFQRENKLTQGMGTGCLMLIVQMIFAIALYRVISNTEYFLGVERFAQINKSFFWIPNLSEADPTGFVLPLINSLSQLAYSYLNTKNMAQANPQGASMNTMMYVMPIMLFFFFRNLAAGIILYWTVGNVLEIIIRGGARLIGLLKNKDDQELDKSKR